ncbi:MAG: isocitrate lyase/phosphoenolpyruvate mutase family protein [Betaproteobacteria bacterium]|nr:isocitrate lyase/phosphoenolpyruvate mutase family protein [Betaproteobacteria bacterium]
MTLAAEFRRLHVRGDPLVLFNVWDAGTARTVAAAGAKAIATSSWSVAAAHGYDDGQAVTRAEALANLARIVAGVALPVTVDLEAGYGDAPTAVADTVTAAIAAGAVGFNLEDQIVGGEGLYSIEEQTKRIRAAREACEHAKVPAFLNARTDLFLKAAPEQQDEALLQKAIERAKVYADAGADGIFVPGLVNENWIGELCEASPLPVNIMVLAAEPTAQRLAELGVARISHGPAPYWLVMKFLEEAARQIYAK